MESPGRAETPDAFDPPGASARRAIGTNGRLARPVRWSRRRGVGLGRWDDARSTLERRTAAPRAAGARPRNRAKRWAPPRKQRAYARRPRNRRTRWQSLWP